MTARLGCKANGFGGGDVRKKEQSNCVRSSFQSLNTPNKYLKINSLYLLYVVILFWVGGFLYWFAFFRLRIGLNWILHRWYAVESYQGPVPKSRIDRIDGCWVAQWHSQITRMTKYVSRFQILWQNICQMDVKHLCMDIWKSVIWE